MNGRDEPPITGEASPVCEVVRRDHLIAVSGQADIDPFAQVPHPADPRAQVVAVVGRIRERLERVGADLSYLTKLVVFHVPGPGCREWEMRDLLARALGPDVLTTLTMVPLPRLVSPGLLVVVDAYAMRGAGGRRLERTPLEVPGLASLPEPFCHGLRCDEFIFASGPRQIRSDFRFRLAALHHRSSTFGGVVAGAVQRIWRPSWRLKALALDGRGAAGAVWA